MNSLSLLSGETGLLQELRVKNLGIIEDINWTLNAGMNVITGETGAGKSLMIDAIEILLNGSAGDDAIRHGCSEAHIEGVFDLSADERYANLKTFLSEKGLSPEEDILIISYEIKRSKTGQVRVNGRVITKTVLRQVGRFLIDIHGQSQHLSLLDEQAHLDFLDGFAKINHLKMEFASRITNLRELESELTNLKSREQETLRQREFLLYQIDEIRKANLVEGEDEELEKERHIISHAARLKEQALQIYQTLSQNDSSGYAPSVINGLHQAVQSLRKLSELDDSLKPQLESLEKTYYGIEESARDIYGYAERLEFDPHRLEEVESRLDLIRNLKRKFGKSLTDIIAYQAQAQKDLDLVNNFQDRQLELQKTIENAKSTSGKLAVQLSEARKLAALSLSDNVKAELRELDMGQMDFCVSVTQTPSDHGLPGQDARLYAYNSNGIDRVEFMVATNPGEPLKPLAKIASTGELSRFTLALKGALAEADQVPVLIFDEIDIGVGGRSGEIVGKKLWGLARHHQVVCVTHLPQIAVYADAHFGVHKETSDERTISQLEQLDSEARLKEIALMLAGPGYSAAALENARELWQNAETWKNSSKPTPQNPFQLKF
jgi:DNA repair protein RecN (Recombination protein N)